VSKNATLSASMLFLVRVEDGKTQILLQKRAGNIWATGWWDSAASGHVDAGESLTAAMQREAKEEIAIEFSREDIEFIHIQDSAQSGVPGTKMHYYNSYFFVNKWAGEPKICECEKCSHLEWFNIDDLPKQLIPNRRCAIDCYLKKIAYNEFGWG